MKTNVKSPFGTPKYIFGLMGKAGAGKDTSANIIKDYLGGTPIIYSFADPLKKMCSDIFEIPIEWMYRQDLKAEYVNVNFRNPLLVDKTHQWILENVVSDERYSWIIAKPELSGMYSEGPRTEHVARQMMARLKSLIIERDDVIDSDGSGSVFKFTVRLLLQLMGTEIVRNMIHSDFWADIRVECDNKVVLIPDCRFQNELDYILTSGGSVAIVKNSDIKNDESLNNHDSEKFVDVVEDYLNEKEEAHCIIENNLSGDMDSLTKQCHYVGDFISSNTFGYTVKEVHSAWLK